MPDLYQALHTWRHSSRTDDASASLSASRELGAALDKMCAWHRGSAIGPVPLVRSGSVRCSCESPSSSALAAAAAAAAAGARGDEDGAERLAPRLVMKCSLCDQRVTRMVLPLRKAQIQEYACHARRDASAMNMTKTWCDALTIAVDDEKLVIIAETLHVSETAKIASRCARISAMFAVSEQQGWQNRRIFFLIMIASFAYYRWWWSAFLFTPAGYFCFHFLLRQRASPFHPPSEHQRAALVRVEIDSAAIRGMATRFHPTAPETALAGHLLVEASEVRVYQRCTTPALYRRDSGGDSGGAAHGRGLVEESADDAGSAAASAALRASRAARRRSGSAMDAAAEAQGRAEVEAAVAAAATNGDAASRPLLATPLPLPPTPAAAAAVATAHGRRWQRHVYPAAWKHVNLPTLAGPLAVETTQPPPSLGLRARMPPMLRRASSAPAVMALRVRTVATPFPCPRRQAGTPTTRSQLGRESTPVAVATGRGRAAKRCKSDGALASAEEHTELSPPRLLELELEPDERCTVLRDKSVQIWFDEPLLFAVLQDYVMNTPIKYDLTRKCETGIPPWCCFLASWGFPYNTNFRIFYTIVMWLVSIVMMLFGIFDLTRKVPAVRSFFEYMNRPLFDLVEDHVMPWLLSVVSIFIPLRNVVVPMLRSLSSLAAIVFYPFTILTTIARFLCNCGRAGGAVANAAGSAAGTNWFSIVTSVFNGARWLWGIFGKIFLGGVGKCGSYVAKHFTTLQRQSSNCWRTAHLAVYTALALSAALMLAYATLRRPADGKGDAEADEL
tara:strand:- start:97 stop:2457 length:2361 start_codon:yes stop_codon:yes gene_type:complete